MEQTSGETQPKRRGAGRVAFFAHRATIQQRVDEGMSKVLIYDELGDKLGITYAQFTRYAAEFITKPEKQGVPLVAPKPQHPEPSQIPTHATESITQPRPMFQKGERTPNKESLI